MADLKPCPFCGSAAEIVRPGSARVSCIVECTNCGCRLESNENGAGAAWNSRAVVAALDPPPLKVGDRVEWTNDCGEHCTGTVRDTEHRAIVEDSTYCVIWNPRLSDLRRVEKEKP